MKREFRNTVFLSIPLSCILVAGAALLADDWPQWRGPTRDGIWRETGLVDNFAGPQLAIRWREPIGSGYSGPTVADGRVYVTDRQVEPQQVERVHCLDWQTGEAVDVQLRLPLRVRGLHRGAAGCGLDRRRPRLCPGHDGPPPLPGRRAGHVAVEEDAGGGVPVRVPIWGCAAAPLVDGDLVIVQLGGSDGACLVALDKRTGEQLAGPGRPGFLFGADHRPAGRSTRAGLLDRRDTWPGWIRPRERSIGSTPFRRNAW